ncbi:MAG: T9SS type A sorting domain-containing protein [Saprospiraceae bacterium]|nr:T9SS type A sorting domain-containing protein [Saprospiraceae bacterium]
MRRLNQYSPLLVLSAFLISWSNNSLAQPTFSKSFSPSTIGPGSNSLLTFLIENGAGTPVSDLAFTDILPAGVTLADGPVESNCGDAVVTAPAGGGTISLSGGTLAGASNCFVRVYVTASTPGTHMNVSGDLTSSTGNSGTATADLTVATARPGFSKSFSPSTIDLGEVSQLTFTIDNSANANVLERISFTDMLPTGLEIADPPNLVTDCFTSPVQPTIIATAGTNSISFSYIGNNVFPAVQAMSTCTFTLDVVATGAGHLQNVSSDLTYVSNLVNNVSGRAIGTLDVQRSDLHIQKSFVDDPIGLGSTGTLEFTITNFDRSNSASGISFTDDLDAALSGLIAIATPITNPCGVGSQLSGTSLLTLTGGNLAPEGSCTFSVIVQVPAGAVPGTYQNTSSPVSGTVGGAPVVGNAATSPLFIGAVPLFTKTFTDDPVAPGSAVTLEFSIENTSLTDGLSNINFTDQLTSFLGFPVSVSLPSNGFCGAGSSLTLIGCGTDCQSLSMAGGSLGPDESCTFSVSIDIPAGQPGGVFTNTTSPLNGTIGAEAIMANPASDDLVVVSTPSLKKEFSPTAVLPGQLVDLQFTITMESEAPLPASNISFSDDLDAFIPGAAAVGLPMNDVCGTGSQISGTSTINFTGGTLNPGSSCTFTIQVQIPQVAAVGTHLNTSSNLQAEVGGLMTQGIPATAQLSILENISLSKKFLDETTAIHAGDGVDLVFTIANSTSAAASNLAFTDDLSNMYPGIVANIPMPVSFCGGLLFATSGGSVINFTGGSLMANSHCSFTVPLQVPNGIPPLDFENITSSLMQGVAVIGIPAVDTLSIIGDDPFTVTKLVTSPMCDVNSPNYVAPGSVEVNIQDGLTCSGTYNITLTPVAFSNPDGMTPAMTMPASYSGQSAGSSPFVFSQAQPGKYFLEVREVGGCNLLIKVDTMTVTIEAPDDVNGPVWMIKDDMSNTVLDNDDMTMTPDQIDLGDILLDQSICGKTMTYTATGSDNCDGMVVAVDAVKLISNTNLATSVMITADGMGNYSIEITWGYGSTTLVLQMEDLAGNTSQLQITANGTVPGYEICNGIDDDCDGLIDDDDPDIQDQLTWYADSDQDGFGDMNVTIVSCHQPMGYVLDNNDCDDLDKDVNPDAQEICNGIDDDCDGLIDDDDPSVLGRDTWYADTDMDGFGDPNVSMLACYQPMGFVANNSDCDDSNAAINPNNDPTILNCRNINTNILGNGSIEFTLRDLTNNMSCGAYNVMVTAPSGQIIWQEADILPGELIILNDLCAFAGKDLTVMISHAVGLSCQSIITLGHINGPVFEEGRSIDVLCSDSLVSGGDIDGMKPFAYAPCYGELEVSFVNDWPVPYDCEPNQDTAKIIYREYEAFDKSGRRASVIDTIVVFRIPKLHSESFFCPGNLTLYCGDTSDFLSPTAIFNNGILGGELALVNVVKNGRHLEFLPAEIDPKCGLKLHVDYKYYGNSLCQQEYKVAVELKQDCPGSLSTVVVATNSPNQFEALNADSTYWRCEFWVTDLDTLAPIIKIKEPAVWVSTTEHECAAYSYVSPLTVEDDWSGVKQVKATIEGIGTYVLNYNAANKCYESHDQAKLPYKDGPYYVIYEAYDSCHNIYADTGFIYVKDDVRPVAVSDKGVTVSLSDKKAWVDASTFDEGSWDNCGISLLLARRADWYESCINLCDSIDTCWVSEHGDTLWQAFLEPDKHLDAVEAHYAKTLDWLCQDGGTCGEIIYNAWIYDLMKYATIHCQEHPYAVDAQYFRHLIEQGWSEGLYKKFKNSTYLLGGSQTGLYLNVDIDKDTSELISAIPQRMTEIEYNFKTKKLYGSTGMGISVLYELDPETGSVLSSVPHKLGAINGLEFIHGKLYGTYIPFAQEPSVLVVIDPLTGHFVEIGPTGYGPIPGLAYDECSDILYGVTNGFEYDADGNPQYVGEKLVQIDLATGAATEVGLIGYPAVGSIEFAADGLLYGGLSLSSTHPGYLIEIDPGTGAGTLRGDLNIPITGLTSTNQTNCVQNQLDIYEQIGGGWSDAVPFSCEDACGPVKVELLVMDYWCNWSKTWTDVWVEDLTPVNVAKDVVDGQITCKVYRDENYSIAGEDHPVSLEYIVDRAKEGDQDAFDALDHVFGGYCKAWVDPYGNFVDIDGVEIDCDIPFYDSVCYCTSYYEQVRVYDEHLGYQWVDSLVTHCYYEPDTLDFQKGIVAVNCAENVHCEQEVWCDFDHCGQGYIYRKFKIWSGCAGAPADSAYHVPDTIYRHQKIYVGNECALNKYMFDVPGDVEVYSCALEYGVDGNITGAAGPEITGYADYLFDDDCRIVGIAHQDKVFKIVGGDAACYKILRTWYFADWCNTGGEAAVGSWWLDPDIVTDYCVQKIIVTDTLAPVCVITGPVASGDTITIGACEYTLDVDVDASDACGLTSYYWELKDATDSTDHLLVDSGQENLTGGAESSFSISSAGLLPGTYKLIVEVQDECSNESVCEYIITVASGKKPTPVCITTLTAKLTPWDSDGDGEIDTAHAVVWASEFDRSSQPACGDDSLEYRIEFLTGTEDDETAAGDLDYLELGCGDIGSKLVRLWVISHPSNTRDYCDAVLIVTSDFSGCTTQGAGGDISASGPEMTHAGGTKDQIKASDSQSIEVVGDAGLHAGTFEESYFLEQNRPNPFQHETTIGFTLPKAQEARLSIFDVQGRLLKVINGNFQAGYNALIIAKKDLINQGILYYQLETPDYLATRKMVLLP